MSTIAGALGAILFGLLGVTVAVKFARCIRIVPQRREYIIERLGKYSKTWGAGLHILVPFVDSVAYIRDLKEESIEVPPQECFTKDNVRVEVDGVIYISVTNSFNAAYGITDYRFAANVLAQTTTRSIIGTLELDKTFEERDAINRRVLQALDEVSEAWGIKVHRYEVKNIVPPPTVRDAMERQMGAERDRRALLQRAQGEKEARINKSLGTQAELINNSEGEKQRRINEAQGRASEVIALAQATSESVEKMGWALAQPGGADAIKLQLSKRYLDKLQALGHPRTNIVLPTDMSRLDDWLGAVGLGEDSPIEVTDEEIAANAGRPAPEFKPLKVPDAEIEAPRPVTTELPALGAGDAASPVPTLVDGAVPAGVGAAGDDDG